MKRIVLFLLLAASLVSLAPLASAQDRFQVGAYADYFRISQTDTNMAGLGGRAAFKIFSHVMFEGEMSYDFEQAFTERCLSSGCTVTVANGNLKVLHGLAGPKIIGGHGRFRPFVMVKGGVINFRLDPRPASFSGFVSSVDNLRSNNVSGVLYPGAGFETHLGPVGLRLEAGDEIYSAGGTHHNARVAFGPFIRF